MATFVVSWFTNTYIHTYILLVTVTVQAKSTRNCKIVLEKNFGGGGATLIMMNILSISMLEIVCQEIEHLSFGHLQSVLFARCRRK